MTPEEQLPPLRDVIKRLSLSANKSLGQNFLLDMNLTRKIARHAGASNTEHFLEIGAGPGGLTRALLAEGVRHVTVIEKDSRCIPALEEIARVYPDKLTIIEGDALKINLHDIIKPNYRIAANLPYNISSDILTSWLCTPDWPPLWTSATLMYQKEFAVRLKASPDTKDYSRLSVLCGWRAGVDILFDVHPSAFTPPPKITSCVVRITPKQNIIPCDMRKLEDVTRASFGQRRKMLRSSLKSISNNPEKLCFNAGISPEKRADHVTIEEYLRLANGI